MSCLNIIQPPKHKHFNGWVSIIESLCKNFSRKDFILHPFLDRDTLFFSDNLKALKGKPWMGIIHFPTHGAPLMHPNINSVNVVKYINASEYKEKCNGLITLTAKSQKILSAITDIPIYRAWHPKSVDNYEFKVEKYFKRPTLRHPGKAYRNFTPYFTLNTKLNKVIHIQPECSWQIDHNLEIDGKLTSDYQVEINKTFLPNKQYIKNLTTSIGFGYYFDCEASNAILEHLMTHTPIIVNRLPSIEEYLGSDYPMYYENISSDPDRFLLNRSFIHDVSKYLKSRSQMREFTIDYFCKTINSL